MVHAISAVTAEVVVASFRNPFEIVKQQMQAGLHRTGQGAIRAILASPAGWRGLYTGYLPTIMRDAPFDVLQFTMYEYMKAELRARKTARARREAGAGAGGAPSVDLVAWENALLGSVSGGIAAAATTPLDVVKTRLMTQVGTRERAAAAGAGAEAGAGAGAGTAAAAAGGGADPHRHYVGVADTVRRIVREEGWRTLFAGIRPRVMWISAGGAIFIGSFEEFRRRLVGGGS
jgi:solute carrier family 25 S-adenosylmethionine transporter 26